MAVSLALAGITVGGSADAGDPATDLGARRQYAAAQLSKFRPSARPAAAYSGGERAELFDDDTLLVRYAKEVDDENARRVAEEAGGARVASIPQLDFDVVATDGEPAAQMAARLRQDERVELVELNALRQLYDDPDDEDLVLQNHVFASRLPAAWDVTHGSSTIDIAILDTGVDLNHPDLEDRIVPGRDIVNGDSTAEDDAGHGTLAAGIAAADTDNATGVAGAAWDARIMPVKVFPEVGPASDSDIVEGIVWATDHGAEVINMSFGGPTNSAALTDAVDYATDNGVVVVAAAGNEASTGPSYPAALDRVIAVGATDDFGDVALFSNRGSFIDTVAPAVAVYSTAIGGEYDVGTGTSFSAPIVSGVAAMVLARTPSLSPAQVENRIRFSSIDRGPRGFDNYYGFGALDAYAAVGGRKAGSPPVPVADSGEPDDVFDRARAITVATSGSISPEGDIDWFFADAPGAGTLTVTVSPQANFRGLPQSFDPVLTGWSPDLDLLKTVDANGGEAAEVLQLGVATAGRYRFRVENFLSSRAPGPQTDPDRYTVTSSFVSGAPTVTPGSKLWVRSTSPADFATGLSTSTAPTITFGRDLNPSSISANTVQFFDATAHTAWPASRNYDPATRRITLTPTSPLVPGRPYLVVIDKVTDAAANVMADPHTFRFTVGGANAPTDLDSDFDGDGFEDIVISAPDEDIGSATDGGVVHVLYGGSSGASGSGSQLWHQDTAGVQGAAESGDRFGLAVTTGDINDDGFDDLVVGAPGENLGSIKDAGAVHVLFGSEVGLRSNRNQLATQDTSGVPGTAETGDKFGGAVAVGEFDNNEGDDLAVGAAGEAIGSRKSAGAVNVLSGSEDGVTGAGAALWYQDSPGIDFFAEAGDRFGSALAVGDIHGDGHDDLAIGAPTDDISSDLNEGSVTLLRGTIVGLRPAGVLIDLLTEDAIPEAADRFGASLAFAELGGFAANDAYDDLVIGAPGQRVVSRAKAGNASVVYFNHSEFFLATESIDQSTSDLGTAETGAAFATSLAGARSNDAALVAGVPHDNIGSKTDAGSVHVFAGGGRELSTGYIGLGGVTALTQNSPEVPGSAEVDDRFGWSVALADIGAEDVADIIIGVPEEDLGNVSAAGAVYVFEDVLRGGETVLLFSQQTSGVSGTIEAGDRFGKVVAG